MHVPWDGALYRAGIRRVAGPFAHPICHGFFFSMAIPVLFSLIKAGLPTNKAWRWFLLGGTSLGLLCSVSRGPIAGTIIALGFAWLGTRKNRGLVIGLSCLCALLVAPLIASGASKYLSVSRGEATTESQETAAYRKEMLENYLEVVRERPVVGFGRYQIPVVKGQKSIVNQYLFLTLTHGLPHAILFLALMAFPIMGLVARSGLRARGSVTDVLAWGVGGALLGAIFTQTTVFAGTQTAQVLHLLSGVAVTLGQGASTRTRTAGS